MSKTDLRTKLTTYPLKGFDYSAVDDDVAAQARGAADRIRGHEKAAAVEIGKELIAVKEALAHGQFIAWIDAEFGYSRRTATNLMQVAAEFGEPAKWETVSHLPTAVIYKLAAPSTPAAIRDAVTKVEAGARVTPSSVKQLIADTRHREAKKEILARRRDEEAEEVRKTGLHRSERFERERDEGRRKRAAADAEAAHAVDRLRFWLGGYFGEFRALMKTVERYSFSEALFKMTAEMDRLDSGDLQKDAARWEMPTSGAAA